MPAQTASNTVRLVNETDKPITLTLRYSTTVVTADPIEEPADGNGHDMAVSRVSRLAVSLTKRKDADEHLTIQPETYVDISREMLSLYDYQSMVDSGLLRIIENVEPKTGPAFKVVGNKTARRIGINRAGDAGSRLVIAPFGRRRVSITNLERFDYRPWEELNLIRVDDDEQDDDEGTDWWIPALGILAWGWLGVLVLDAIGVDEHAWYPENFSLWLLWPAAGIVAFLVTFLWKSQKGQLVRGLVGQTVNLLMMLVLGPIGLPILVGLFFGGMLASVSGLSFTDVPTELLSRGIQVVLIILLSALPGLLYFQFERRQIRSLRTRFIRDIMMINPCIHTEDDAEAMYGSMVDEVSGAIGASKKQFAMFSVGRPILLATLLFTIGWILALWPVGELGGDVAVTDLLVPQQIPIIFAFLGAYLFALNLIFRRYARGDLTPKAYSHVTIRILSAVIIVWVVQQVFGVGVAGTSAEEAADVWLLVAAFGIGIIPETGIALLKDFARGGPVGKWFPSLSVKHPISDLEGISLYDQARLLEEGIESVENLAHHNLIELMLRSGIPTPRLVDLLDQAILYLHVVDIDGAEDPNHRTSGAHTLRGYGIRTATDLLQAVASARERVAQARKRKQSQPEALPEAQMELEKLLSLLDRDGESPRRMQLVLDAVRDDEWLEYVVNWRSINRGDEILTDPDAFYETAAAS